MNAQSQIRFALVGCGAIAQKHAAALSRLDQACLAAVYDVDERSARTFGEKHGVPAFTNIDELVEKTDPHVFSILTPSGLHSRNVLDLMRFNRHFVVEKPLALRLDQIDEILEEGDKRGVKIFVVQQNRFNPPVAKLKEAIDAGRFGKLVLGTVRVRWCRKQSYYDEKSWRGTWAYDGGVLTNQASHHIDMLIWMMGEAESVMAKTTTSLVKIEAEDTGVAIIKFKNGALGVVEATTAARPRDLEGSISVLGEKGSVEIGGFFMNELKTWNFTDPEPFDDDVKTHYSRVPDVQGWNHTEFLRNVTQSLRDNTRGLIDGLEGRKSVELINAIYESAESGREVFLKFTPKMCKLGVVKEK